MEIHVNSGYTAADNMYHVCAYDGEGRTEELYTTPDRRDAYMFMAELKLRRWDQAGGADD